MKQKIKKQIVFFLLLFAFVLVPINTKAFTYNSYDFKTMNFMETLEDEKISAKFKDYSENDDQAVIYLFRGHGCGYCQNFLKFMNSIASEYGKYFKMVTFEVWNDYDNSALLDEVSTFLNNPAGGVPYIVIGNKVFPGYASDFDEDIKSAIVTLYNTSKEQRYDVFEEMEKEAKKFKLKTDYTDLTILICNFIFIGIGTGIIILYIHNKDKKLNEKLLKIETSIKEMKMQEEKKEVKKITKKVTKKKD